MPAPPLVEPPACRAGRWRRGSCRGSCCARGRGQDQPGAAGVDDDRHAVVLAELLDQHLQPLLDQRQLVGLVHRARDVDQEDEVARPAACRGRFALPLMADPRQPVLGVPGAAGDLDVDRERLVARWAGGRSVGEVIDHLLDPDGVRAEAADPGRGSGGRWRSWRCRRRSRRSTAAHSSPSGRDSHGGGHTTRCQEW